MPFVSNQRDINLLHNNPNQLILELQELIDIIIYQFVRTGSFRFGEKQDIKQQINLELINRLATIQKQYQGKSLLRTYLAEIIRNICLGLLRSRKRGQFIFLEDNNHIREASENINPLIFEEEIARLKKIMDLYYRLKYKLMLCLKLRFKMIVDFEDFTRVHKNITWEEFIKFVDLIKPYAECTDKKIFTALITVFNRYENKNNTPDSLRKWITGKISEIIEILNGNPPASNYDKDTFQILFEKSYINKNNINRNRIRIEV